MTVKTSKGVYENVTVDQVSSYMPTHALQHHSPQRAAISCVHVSAALRTSAFRPFLPHKSLWWVPHTCPYIDYVLLFFLPPQWRAAFQYPSVLTVCHLLCIAYDSVGAEHRRKSFLSNASKTHILSLSSFSPPPLSSVFSLKPTRWQCMLRRAMSYCTATSKQAWLRLR